MWVHPFMIPLCLLYLCASPSSGETASQFRQRNGRFPLVLLVHRRHTYNDHSDGADRLATT